MRTLLQSLLLLLLTGISSASVSISSPANGSTVGTTARVVASTTTGVTMRIYVDNVNVYQVHANNLDTNVSLSVGSHTLAIVAWDSAGTSSTARITVTASSSGGGTPAPPPSSGSGITVSSPASGATVSSPVHFVASQTGAVAMHIYVDYQLSYNVNADHLDTSLAMGSGAHNVTVQSWNQAGTVTKNSFTISVSGGSTPPPSTPSGAKVYSSMNKMSGWDSCDTCSGGGNVSFSKTQVSDPADSTQFFIGRGDAWAQALWWLRLGNNTSISHFVLEMDQMMEVPSASFGLEFNVNQVLNGKWYKFSTQCSFGWGIWQVWDAANSHWVKTTVPCTRPQAMTWRHLRLEYERSNGQDHFISIGIDGKTYPVDMRFYPQPVSYTNGDFGVHFQLNGNADMIPYSVFVRNYNLTVW